jgi:hypothetical protein
MAGRDDRENLVAHTNVHRAMMCSQFDVGQLQCDGLGNFAIGAIVGRRITQGWRGFVIR